jgi:hypothetical protein
MSTILQTITHPNFTATLGPQCFAPAGRELLAAWTRAGVPDLRGLASELAAVARGDPEHAAQLLTEIQPPLTPADRQCLVREFAAAYDAVPAPGAQAGGAPDGQAQATDPAGGTSANGASLALDGLQLALSVAGIFDPTPTCDAIDGLISLLRGDYAGAGISALGMLPYVGDVAKLGRLGKLADTAAQVADIAKSTPPIGAALPALGSARNVPDVLPNFSRSGFLADLPPVTLGYSQHIARGDMNACASGAAATVSAILERGHAFPERIPNRFYEVHAQLETMAPRNGRWQPNMEDVRQVLALRGFPATLQNGRTLPDLMGAARRGPVVFSVTMPGQWHHALALDALDAVTRRGPGAPATCYRLFNPDEFSDLASGLYDAGELAAALAGRFTGDMVTTR